MPRRFRLAARRASKAHVAALGRLAAGPLARGRRACSRTSAIDASARRAGAAGRPPDRFLHRRFAHAARPHRARVAGVGRRPCRAITPCSACTRSVWRKRATTRAPKRLGRSAVELEPRDGWAQHAVAHVMEMQSRQRDGIAWMRANPEAWTQGELLAGAQLVAPGAVPLELGEIDEVLRSTTGRSTASVRPLALNMVDASALLWRLHLRGVDVGDRWAALADNWAPMAGAGNYAFNDAHAMMAFVGAGLDGPAATLLEAQRAGDARPTTTMPPSPAMSAIPWRWRSRRSATATMRETRAAAPADPQLSRTASAAAMRSATCIDLTLIEAALRAGDVGAGARACGGADRARPDEPAVAAFREPGGADMTCGCPM